MTAPARAAQQSAPAPATTEDAPRPTSILDKILDHQSAVDLGRKLVPTGYLPDHIKTPEQAMAIILTGQEMGMKPMRALRSLMLVKGKVTENADSQLARFKTEGGRAVWRQLDEQKAVLWLRHPNGDEHTETFTIEDARRAGLLSGNQWKTYPKAMLRSRAITAGLKSLGWEGGVGTYDPDELPSPAQALAEAEAEARTSMATVADQASRALHAVTAAPAARADASGAEGMTLAAAKLFPFPFQRGKPVHGRPLGDIKSDMLESVAAWIREKQDEEGGNPQFHADTLAAVRLILDDRQKDQVAMPLDVSAATGESDDVDPMPHYAAGRSRAVPTQGYGQDDVPAAVAVAAQHMHDRPYGDDAEPGAVDTDSLTDAEMADMNLDDRRPAARTRNPIAEGL